MLRLFLLGLLLVGLATGFRNQWLTVNWNKMLGDMGLPAADTEEEPIDFNRLIIGEPSTLSLIHISEPTRLGMIS